MNSLRPPFLLSRPRRAHRGSTRGPQPIQQSTTTGDRRLTIIHSNSGDEQQQQQPIPTTDIDNRQLVLREFDMPLQADPALYERKVRAECLREGGAAATVVRWHISRADQNTGRAHVEVRLLR